MATLAELTDPYAGSLRPVPPPGAGVCDVCHGGPNGGFVRCWSCEDSIDRVRYPVTQVLPISLMTTSGNDQLYHLLRSYKRFSGTPMQIARVAGLIGRHLANHAGCLTGDDGWDTVTTVPSTRGKTDHPLVKAVRGLRHLGPDYEELLEPDQGPFERHARDDMFKPKSNLDGRRVLLIDDTFTSGSRVQSAASALGQAGAEVVAALVVGRVINPSYNDACDEIWTWSTENEFDFARCALCL